MSTFNPPVFAILNPSDLVVSLEANIGDFVSYGEPAVVIPPGTTVNYETGVFTPPDGEPFTIDFEYAPMLPFDPYPVWTPEVPPGFTAIQCRGEGPTIAVNDANIGDTFSYDYSAFIPPQPDPTYLLQIGTWVWYPNPALVYTLDDGKQYKWDVAIWQWVPFESGGGGEISVELGE
jgi:hypothetical protein